MSKEKLNENYVDLKPVNQWEGTPEESYATKFKAFLAEEAKIESKKVDKEVEEVQSHGFDYSETKNVDNLNGQEFMNGVYFEAKQSPDKTLEQIKEIVAKNLSKDELHYVKNGQFGEDGVGYQEMKNEEVSGAHKASGYSDKLKSLVKESLIGGVVTTGNPNSFAAQQAAVINQMMTEDAEEDAKNDADYKAGWNDDPRMDEMDEPMTDEIGFDEGYGAYEYEKGKEDEASKMEVELEEEKEKDTKKSKDGKSKKESVAQTLSRIDRVGTGVALEAKINAIDEEISTRNEQLTMLDENEAMSALMDKGKIKELRKEVKLLEKQKAKYDKMYEKATGKKRAEIVDETEI